MTIDNDKTISVLNELIETCKDGENGFREAAEHVNNSHLKTVFLEFSRQRAQFAGQLQSEVSLLGGTPEKSGSSLAAAHRGWIDLKAAFTGGGESAVVAECERGEDSAKDTYRKALEASLPSNIRSVVEQQYAQVKQAHDRIRSLEVKLDS
ncbi:MAG TPA: PA2169 family four-helix-bundle protein [Bryobacteraceae bacterium]|nr:PA2169 family four-helix-bundle protein [Bryobacteraceae bacterium]